MEWNTTSTVLDRLHQSEGESAWELFVDHFRETLVRFAERVGLSRTDAQDAAQEALVAFVEGYRAGRYDRSRGRLKSWLFGIARRQALALRRVRARDLASPTGAGEGPDFVEQLEADDSSEQAWEEEWQRTVFTRALERVRGEVSPSTFDIFRAVVFEELSTEAVCERFSIERTKVYNVKHRVSRRLNELIKEFEDA